MSGLLHFHQLQRDASPRQDQIQNSTSSADNISFRAYGFANKQTLAAWFPRINDDENTSWRIRFSKRNRALFLKIVLIATVFIANLTLSLFSSSKFPSREGIGLIYTGDCGTVKSLNRYLHLLINVLSTAMLSASNFCVQLQMSPTRADIDNAHKQNRWLDIGVPSLRNLRYVGRWRLVACIVLLLSSLPVHLTFNSAVFQALGSDTYVIAVTKDSFALGADWKLSTAERNRYGDFAWAGTNINYEQNYHSIISNMQGNVTQGRYERRNVSACYALYDDSWGLQGNGVIFVKNVTEQGHNDSLLLYVGVTPRWDDWPKNMWASSNGTGQFTAISPPQPVLTWFLGPPRYEVSHCLVEIPKETKSRCRLQYSTYILYIVITLNFIKLFVLCMVWASRKTDERRRNARQEELGADANPQERIIAPKEAIIATLGDAIASFMREPDQTTKDMCLTTRYDMVNIRTREPRNQQAKQKEHLFTTTYKWNMLKKKQRTITTASKQWMINLFRRIPWLPRRGNDTDEAVHPRKWKMEKKRWLSAVSWKQWSFVVFLYGTFFVALTITLLRLLSMDLRHRHLSTSLSYLYSLGFGALTPQTYLVGGLPKSDPLGPIVNVIVINSPQLLLSLIYTLCEVVITKFLVQREFSLFSSSSYRKTLRVSEPVGIQRSSYFISVPFRYGIPLDVFSTISHWLVSQTFFLARVTALLSDGAEDYSHSFSTLGVSPFALFITILVGIINVIILVLLGCRKYDGTMPLVSTNSKAISAACHSLPEDREYGSQLPVQWGVVEINENGLGHCTFTTAPCHVIRELQRGMLYQ